MLNMKVLTRHVSRARLVRGKGVSTVQRFPCVCSNDFNGM